MKRTANVLTAAANDAIASKGLSGIVLVALAVVVVILLIGAVIRGTKDRRDRRDRRRFYTTVASMWGLASHLARPAKDASPDVRVVCADIKRFQTQNKKLRGYDDPRMFDFANELYKLLSKYASVSGDADSRKRLDAQVEALESTGLW